MNENFDRAFEFAMKWEGYKSTDPDDPGGRTIFGISSRSWPLVVSTLWNQPKEEAREHAKDFYLREYWEKAGCSSLLWPVDIIIFDTAVNLGVARALDIYSSSMSPFDFLMKRISFYVEHTMQKFLRGVVRRAVALYKEIS